MSDDRDGYASTTTAWESGVEPSDRHSPYDRLVAESADERASSFAHHSFSTSPQHRSSIESPSVNGHSKSLASHRPWRDNTQPAPIERRDTLSTVESGTPSLVEPTFDENVLRALCELDVSIKRNDGILCLILLFIKCGVPLVLDRIKQSMVSCRVCYSLCLSRSLSQHNHFRRHPHSLKSARSLRMNTVKLCRNSLGRRQRSTQ